MSNFALSERASKQATATRRRLGFRSLAWSPHTTNGREAARARHLAAQLELRCALERQLSTASDGSGRNFRPRELKGQPVESFRVLWGRPTAIVCHLEADGRGFMGYH